MIHSDIDYDIYYGKHCARYYGWLPASKEYKNQIRRAPKYFTLCGPQVIDVFMLEYEKVLARDENKNLSNVIICEDQEDAWTEIFKKVRPPIKEAMILGKLQDILTFEDDEDTRGISPDADVRSFKIRKKLIIKGKFEQLKKHFPFDIINFDPCESLLDQDLKSNKLYQAFKRIFELQKSIDTFLLLITTNITDIHSDVQSRFRSSFKFNVSKYPKIRDALLSSVGTIIYDKIDENKIKALSFAKSIVMKVARGKCWDCEHCGIHIYEYKREGTRMLSSIVKISKQHATKDESPYLEDIIRVIENMPEYYSYEDSLNNLEVRNHLDKIVEYRDRQKNLK